MSKDYTEEALRRQAIAAKDLLNGLREDGMSDEDMIDITDDAVEGETGFFEVAQRLLDKMDDHLALVEACNLQIARIEKRKARAEKSAERMRATLDQAWQLAEVGKHEFANATISPKKVPPKLIVTEESEIPSRFFKEPEPPKPKLDRKMLTDELKTGASVAGATMSNGGMTIQIRRA